MKLKNTLRHLRGEELITHLGAEYYDVGLHRRARRDPRNRGAPHRVRRERERRACRGLPAGAARASVAASAGWSSASVDFEAASDRTVRGQVAFIEICVWPRACDLGVAVAVSRREGSGRFLVRSRALTWCAAGSRRSARTGRRWRLDA